MKVSKPTLIDPARVIAALKRQARIFRRAVSLSPSAEFKNDPAVLRCEGAVMAYDDAIAIVERLAKGGAK